MRAVPRLWPCASMVVMVGSGVASCRPAARDAHAGPGPILIASFPAASQRQIESDERTGRLLHDFQAQLDEVREPLANAGVAVVEWYAPEVALATESTMTVFAAPLDSAQVMYYLVAPARRPCMLRGVHPATELLRAASRCFDLSAIPADGPR